MTGSMELQIERPGHEEPMVVPLIDGRRYVIGRDPQCDVVVAWDPRISRQHVEIVTGRESLKVRRLSGAHNPLFYAGKEVDGCTVRCDEHFVLGMTTFLVRPAAPEGSPTPSHRPVEEVVFSSEALAQIHYRDADRRIEVLAHLPDLIAGAHGDSELQTRLVNLLLAGVPRAEAAGLVTMDATGRVEVLQWNRRHETAGALRPSQRLVHAALRERKQSILSVWEQDRTSVEYTAAQEFDWAICSPVPRNGAAGELWGLYLAGRSDDGPVSANPGGVADRASLKSDVKFADVVASIIGAVRRLRYLERQQSGIRQFLPPAVLGAIGDDLNLELLEPREETVTVLFCDLRGFSRQAESFREDLPGLLQRVSQALGVMTRCISQHGGVIGDFQGDAAMGFWGWPMSSAEDPLQACRAALAIRREFELAARTPGHPLVDFRMGIGLAHGRAVAGRIGTGEHFVFTAFGPVVNLASRLESMTRQLRVPIVIDDALAGIVRNQMPADEARLRTLARLQPFGLDTPVLVSELLPGLRGAPELTNEHLAAYNQAVEHFIAGRWDEAFSALRSLPAADRAQDFLAWHITQNNRIPPPGWNGVIKLPGK